MNSLVIALLAAPAAKEVQPETLANPAYQGDQLPEAAKPIPVEQGPVEIDSKSVVELVRVQLVEEGELEVVDEQPSPEPARFVDSCLAAYQVMKEQMDAEEAKFKKNLSEEIALKQITSSKKRKPTTRAKP